jgi:hypothetical protein
MARTADAKLTFRAMIPEAAASFSGQQREKPAEAGLFSTN